MLAQRARFLEHRDLEVAERSAGLRVRFRQPRQLDRAREAGRSAADEHDIHRHVLRVRRLGHDESLGWQRRLILGRQNGQRSTG